MIKYLLITLLPLLAQAQPSFKLHVLGTVQDGGSPHVGCVKSCCTDLSLEAKELRKVSCLAVKNDNSEDFYIFDATPDFSSQIKLVNKDRMPKGIFLTHAHIGHYTGLMYLGREAKGAKNVPVYGMSRMLDFINNNGPWSQLMALENIVLKKLTKGKEEEIEKGFTVTPIQVPHRDEFSETVGFIISLNSKKVLFLPDIDKWEKWETKIEELIPEVDLAFIDATFYDQNEIARDMSEVPHPFVVESMARLRHLSKKDKLKVNFIHLNHSNPLLKKESEAYKNVIAKDFNVAKFGNTYEF